MVLPYIGAEIKSRLVYSHLSKRASMHDTDCSIRMFHRYITEEHSWDYTFSFHSFC